MCFSAEASFAGAAVLGAIGYATTKYSPSKEDLLWTAIPVFFGLQQFCEGLVWLGMSHQVVHQQIAAMAKDMFLFFALGFWPVWIPLAFLLAEKESSRKKLMMPMLLFGLTVAYVNLSTFPPLKISPNVVGHSIQYFGEPIFFKKLYYLAAVTVPCFISSIKNIWTFGAATAISFVAAEYFYTRTFTSVWCFAAALLSVILLIVARKQTAVKTI